VVISAGRAKDQGVRQIGGEKTEDRRQRPPGTADEDDAEERQRRVQDEMEYDVPPAWSVAIGYFE
jgi:hypothetical protein